MFNSEFFPTPTAVIDMMTSGLDLLGKSVLEPSAGKGDIVDYLKAQGANVIACELHPELQMIVSRKCRLIKPDFLELTPEQISHIEYIIMNPPFSNADRHIQHAWDIAPEGCQIIALANVETIKNRYSTRRTVLHETIEKHGRWGNIGNVFSTAERTTDIDVALIHIFKPKTGSNEFDDYFFDMSEEQEETVEGSGIMKHNEFREIVNRYVGAVKMFDAVTASNAAINGMIGPISTGLNISFGAHVTRDRFTSEITRDVFKKELQKSAWRSIFARMNMNKYVTRGVMDDINKFVEQQQAVPFTMGNIYKMIDIIVGTHASRMDMVLVEAFDYICSLSADNSSAGEKWKTNSDYTVNKRFIRNYMCEYDARWPKDHVCVRYSSSERIDDVVKALCHLTGSNYDEVMTLKYTNDHGRPDSTRNELSNFFRHNYTPWGEWVEWNKFFKVRGYKKGTMHFEFADEKVWMDFNIRVAKIKGWAIPRRTDTKARGAGRKRQTGVEAYQNF